MREYLDRFSNLQMIGRNGQHRYNNQDHSMLTGIYAARNINGENYDIWNVNTEPDYHEEDTARSEPASADRAVPIPLTSYASGDVGADVACQAARRQAT